MKRAKGVRDILPVDINKWNFVESKFVDICNRYGYKEIRTPIFEYTELFVRGVGDTSDIVTKEMYTFKDKGNRSLTLKPEGTAPVVRAIIENGLLSEAMPQKYFYNTPCFRYERPQQGRQRQFHQFGVEAIGPDNPKIDAEVIDLIYNFLIDLGVDNLIVQINSVGCPICRAKYQDILLNYLNNKLANLCSDCNSRVNKNPMRIIDCKNEKCKEQIVDIPLMADYLCDDCKNDYEKLQEYLDILNINYKRNPYIVRGLDYYSKTAFEIQSDDLGAQNTICGGGRYNGLFKEIGNSDVTGIGFGLGIERLLNIIDILNIDIPENNKLDAYIITTDEAGYRESLKLRKDLLKNGIKCDINISDKSFKSQLKTTNKSNIQYGIIIGTEELSSNKYSIKDFYTGEQKLVNKDELINIINNKEI